jgi:hypothetical protein
VGSVTALIPLHRGRGRRAPIVGWALVDAADAALVDERRWTIQRAPGDLRYAISQRSVGGRNVQTLMHRLILGDEAREHTDHKNGDGLDNRRENLRPCSHAENMQNRNRHPLRGISQLPSGRWRVRVRDTHSGVFDTVDEAIEAARTARAATMPFATN